MDSPAIPDPRVRQGWSAKEDQLAIIIAAVCPFHDVRQALPLLRHRTPAEIFARYGEIISDDALQQRVIDATGGDVIGHTAIRWQPVELLAMAALLHDGGFARPADALARYPHLFHPTRTPESFRSMARRIGAARPNALEVQIKKYLEWAEELRARVDGSDSESGDSSDSADSEEYSESSAPPAPPAERRPFSPPVSRRPPEAEAAEEAESEEAAPRARTRRTLRQCHGGARRRRPGRRSRRRRRRRSPGKI
jgi:hypothetical protein